MCVKKRRAVHFESSRIIFQFGFSTLDRFRIQRLKRRTNARLAISPRYDLRVKPNLTYTVGRVVRMANESIFLNFILLFSHAKFSPVRTLRGYAYRERLLFFLVLPHSYRTTDSPRSPPPPHSENPTCQTRAQIRRTLGISSPMDFFFKRFFFFFTLTRFTHSP